MKAQNIATLLVLIANCFILKLNTFAQEEIFFDCVPVDYNTTASQQHITNYWLNEDKIIIETKSELHDYRHPEYYLIEDGKTKFLLETWKVEDILFTETGFFIMSSRGPARLDILFYNENTEKLSEIQGGVLYSRNRFQMKVYEEGLLYRPSIGEGYEQLYFTDGSPESTFYFKEFKGYPALSYQYYMDFLKCGDRFFSTGIGEGHGSEGLFELDIENKTATRISAFDISSDLICHNDKHLYFTCILNNPRVNNIARFDVNTYETDYLLNDSLASLIRFASGVNNVSFYSLFEFYGDNLILEVSSNTPELVNQLWSVNINNYSAKMLAELEITFSDRPYYIKDDFFYTKVKNTENPQDYKELLIVYDAVQQKTFKVPLLPEVTGPYEWNIEKAEWHNNKIYFSLRKSALVDEGYYALEKRELYEINNGSVINTGLIITDLLKVDGHLLYITSLKKSRRDAPKILWNYNNGEPVELINSFIPGRNQLHNNKLYFDAITEDRKGEIFITDGTQEGTNLLLTNSENYRFESVRFMYNKDVLYYYKLDNTLGLSLYQTNPNTNMAELISVPFPFTPGSHSKTAQISNPLIYNSFIHIANEDYGNVIYRKANNTFFLNSNGLWFSNGAPENAQLLLPAQSTNGITSSIMELHGKYWFVDYSDSTNQKLYSTDGTIDGTQLAYDIYTTLDNDEGLPNSNGIFFKTATGGVAFYNAIEDTLYQLPIRAINELNGVYNEKLIEIDDTLNQLYVSDGTIENSNTYSYGQYNTTPFLMDDKVLMIDNETNDLYNVDDNFKPKDRLVEKFWGESKLYRIDIVEDYPKADGKMLFYGSGAQNSPALWFTDGTKENTKQITDKWLGHFTLLNTYIEKENTFYFVINNFDEPDSLFLFNVDEFRLYKAEYFSSGTNEIFDIDYVNDQLYLDCYNDLFGRDIYSLSKEPVDPLCQNKFLIGSVFYDANNNSIKDKNEHGVPGIPILLNNKTLYNVVTDNVGNFSATVANGAFEVTASAELGCYELSTTTTSFWVDSLTRYAKNLNFPIVVDNDSTSNGVLDINITSAPTRCNILVPFWITAYNFTCDTLSDNLILNLDEKIEFIADENLDFNGVYSAADHTLNFNLDSLHIFQQTNFKVELKMPNEDFLGEKITIHIALNEKDNVLETFTSEIRCAIDPNDKLVSPNREDPDNKNYTEIGESLQYTIRFQNTGTDTAFNVKLMDTLSNKLNYQSLELFSLIIFYYPIQQPTKLKVMAL